MRGNKDGFQIVIIFCNYPIKNQNSARLQKKKKQFHKKLAAHCKRTPIQTNDYIKLLFKFYYDNYVKKELGISISDRGKVIKVTK